MSGIEIIDGGRWRRCTAAEKLRVVEVEGTVAPVGPRKPRGLEDHASISVVARQHFYRCAAQWRCTQPGSYRWQSLMLEEGSVAVTEDDDVTGNKVVRQLEDRIRERERHLGRKTLE